MNLNLTPQELLSLYKVAVLCCDNNANLASALLKLESALSVSLELVESMENEKNYKSWLSSEEQKIANLEDELKNSKILTGFDKYVDSQNKDVKDEMKRIVESTPSKVLTKNFKPVKTDKKKPVGRPKKK